MQKTLNLPTLEQAIKLVGGDSSALGTKVQAPDAPAAGPQKLDDVVKDVASLNRLADARANLIDNVKFQLGSKK